MRPSICIGTALATVPWAGFAPQRARRGIPRLPQAAGGRYSNGYYHIKSYVVSRFIVTLCFQTLYTAIFTSIM